MKLTTKLKRCKTLSKKTELWFKAEMSREQTIEVLREMVLSLPKGAYKLHSREYGTNLVDAIWELYGWMPSLMIDEPLLLGLQVLYPKKVYASFTLGLDAIELL